MSEMIQSSVKPGYGKEFYQLTHPQKRIWYIEKLYPNTSLNNIGGVSKVSGKVNFKLLEDALNLFIKRNDGIRLRFTERNGEVLQYFSDFSEVKIDFFDFSSRKDPEGEFSAWTMSEMEKPFTLLNSDLFYFAMYKVNDEKTGFLGKFHHIIADGWSINILTDEVYRIYQQLSNGEEVEDSLRYSYTEYINHEQKYLNSERFIKNQTFWKEKFADIPEPLFHTKSDSINGERVCFPLENNISEQIQQFCAANKFSLNTFFTALFLIYLSKTTQRRELVIGLPVLNRSGEKEKSIFGMFTSTMPFRFVLDGNNGALQIMGRINEELKKFYFHQKYPYDLLIQDLELKKKGYDGLFQVSVNYYNTKVYQEADGFPVATEELYNGKQFYLMQLIIKEWDRQGKITLEIDYKLQEFSKAQINQVFKCLLNLIDQVLTAPSLQVSKLNLLSESEKDILIYRFNSSKNEYPKDKTIHQLFEEQVIRTPDRIAIEFEKEQLTYRQLNQRSNQLAGVLRAKGVTPNTIVGLMVTHSIEAVIGILGILKAGGAYLPIDPEYPKDRIGYMLTDSACNILLTNCKTENVCEFEGLIIRLDDDGLYQGDDTNPAPISKPEDLVYVIYTSGSTGKPKGVMIEHRGLVNYIWWAKKVYLRDENDAFALYSSLSFDLTVTSIFTPLIGGNRIIVYRDDGREYVLYRIIKENKATVVKLTPSHLSLLVDKDYRYSSIKRFIVGGEDLKVSLAASIQKSFGKDIEIYNEYGPTETVVGCMIHKFNPDTDTGLSVPIGIPADNVQIYILDRDLNPLPHECIGEMYISGDGVARGYLNQPELTNEKFIANPFIQGKRMYKTGDLAKFLMNGKVEYAGRADQQVKIRGHRIELGEIDKRLADFEAVTNATVIDRQDENGNKYLCAYIVTKEKVTDDPRLVREIREYLAKSLPDYMIPAQFVLLPEIPLTQNGKIDRHLLPEPRLTGVSEVEYVAPANSKEELLLEALHQILGAQEIGMASNFYHYGGDSIKAIQIASKLNDLGLKIKVRDILSHPVISEMAACLEYETNQIDQSPCEGSFKPTPIYQWFFSRNFSDENFYNQSVVLDFKDEISAENLRIIVDNLVRHHDSLRLNYNRNTGELFYNNDLLHTASSVQTYDLSLYSPEEQDQRLAQLMIDFKAGFNIERGVLFKACLFDLGNRGKKVLLTAHHLVVDGVSWRIILEDIHRIYECLKTGEDLTLPLKTNSLKDWSFHLKDYRRTKAINEAAFWDQITKKEFNFPVDFESGDDILAHCNTLTFHLNPAETGRLLSCSGDGFGVKTDELLITALVRTISDFTGEKEVVLELEGHGREDIFNDIDVTRTVGWFTCLYPVALNIPGTEIPEQLKAIKEQLRNIPNHGIGFGLLQADLEKESAKKQKPIRFNFLGDFNMFENKYFTCSYQDVTNDSNQLNQLTALLDINAMIIAGELKISLTYSKNKFKAATINDFRDKFKTHLEKVIQCVNEPVDMVTPSDFEMVKLSQEDLDSILI